MFLASTDEYFFGPAKFPKLTVTEYYAYIKLFTTMDECMSINYYKNMKLPVFRVLFFGKKDPLHIPHLTDASLYYYCYNPESYTNIPYFRHVLKMAGKDLKDMLYFRYGVKDFKVEDIQSYFVYHF